MQMLLSFFPGFQFAANNAGTVSDEDAIMFMVNKPEHVNLGAYFKLPDCTSKFAQLIVSPVCLCL